MVNDIDFVVLWVDDSDPEWQMNKSRFSEGNINKNLNQNNRYRDWEVFHYWFRGVEKYAGWVRKVHLVTAGHVPYWLNTKHPKLNIVSHDMFMPERYLPTFSARPIELNLHRIPGLSEKFIYFNDDMFIINKIKPDYFFNKNTPTDMGIRNVIPGNDYSTVLYNTLQIIERNLGHINPIKDSPFKWFNLKYGVNLIRNLLLFPWKFHLGYYFYHLPTAYLKNDFERVWSVEGEFLDKVSQNKFRTTSDVNHQVIRWWRLVENRFYPFPFNKISRDISLTNDYNVLKPLRKRTYPLVCLNDNEKTNFTLLKPYVKNAFNEIFDSKSNFEK